MRKAIILIIFILSFSGYSFAFDDGDFQYWNTESISWEADKDWEASLEEEFRFGNDGGTLYYQHSDFGVAYSGLANWLDLGVSYRHILEEKGTNWKQENRPHLNAILKWKALSFSLSNRARFEYRNRESAENYWRYRNKLSIKSPFTLTRVEIQPYIEEEIFYDFNAETLNRNRLYGGFSLKLPKNVKGQIFYLWESIESNKKWNDTHILGTKIKLSF